VFKAPTWRVEYSAMVKRKKRDEKVKEMRIIKKVAGGVFSREKKGR
jgi:hypothetical protein